jgi:hypothetical protein
MAASAYQRRRGVMASIIAKEISMAASNGGGEAWRKWRVVAHGVIKHQR